MLCNKKFKNNVLTRTEGIVLKTQQYGEADLIVTYLTLSNGIIKAFAKSPRKTKSRFGSSMEPLTYAIISLWGKEQSMPRITQSDIINSFSSLRESFKDFTYASKLIEILISITPEGIPNKKLFLFLLSVLNFAKVQITKNSELRTKNWDMRNKNKDTMYLIFQVRLLVMLGYAPRLKGCGKCGAKSPDFYPHLGTALCGRCAVPSVKGREFPLRLTDSAINFYSHSIDWPINISTRLKPHHETVSRLSSVMDEHLNHLLGKRLMTSEFLAKVS